MSSEYITSYLHPRCSYKLGLENKMYQESGSIDLHWESCSFPEYKWEERKEGGRGKRKREKIFYWTTTKCQKKVPKKKVLSTLYIRTHFIQAKSSEKEPQVIKRQNYIKLTERLRKLDWLIRKRKLLTFQIRELELGELQWHAPNQQQ